MFSLVRLVLTLASCTGASAEPVVAVRLDALAGPVLTTEPQQLVATATDGGGGPLVGVPITFASGSPAVAGVDADGRLTCREVGTVKVTASASTAFASTDVACRPVAKVDPNRRVVRPYVGGPPFEITAEVFDVDGNLIEGAPIVLESSDPTVVAATGTSLSALKGGNATVTVRSGAAAATIEINAAQVESLDVPQVLLIEFGEPARVPINVRTVPDTYLLGEIRLEPVDPTIVALDEGGLLGQRVAATDVKVTAGSLTRTMKVIVVTREEQPWHVPECGTTAIELPHGYLKLDVRTMKGDGGVALRWEGAACPDRPEARQHAFECASAEVPSLVLSNPGETTVLGHCRGGQVEGVVSWVRSTVPLPTGAIDADPIEVE